MAYRNEVRTKRILDILEKDAFEGETIDPDIERQTEVNFYRGAPPQWLNFYLAEKNEDKTHPSSFIKRDGYEQLSKQIKRKKSGVILHHMPGSGGTTLAMQLLWDFRKSFKCAVLVDPNSQRSLIATAVVDLYIAGNDHKTVLLLVQDENVNTLRESFVAEFAKRKIDSDKDVFVILNCVRVAHIKDHSGVIYLDNKLTDNEKKKFDEKKEWLNHEYKEKSLEFHGFNIMQNNFSKDYVRLACDVFKTTDCRPPVPNRALQLIACLCLLNSYVPGSFFPKFSFDKLVRGFEETMNPFSHLMVSYKSNGSVEEVLRMAHSMIAEQGTQFLHAAGVHRWVTAQILLKECTEDLNTITYKFIKDLLIKRQKKWKKMGKNGKKWKNGKKDNFSRLIMDIMAGNAKTGKRSCLLVLTEAVNRFPAMEQYAQALSRFYYLKNEDFINAEKYAEKAIENAPGNSYMADTLGQVYRHFLYKKVKVLRSNPKTLPEVFDLAKKAFEAFQEGERLAGEAQENSDDLCDDSDLSQQSNTFNYMPKFAYLQVANTLFGSKDIIKRVATKENKSREYKNLISPLPEEIKERARFINELLSYSKKSYKEGDRDNVLREARKCYKDYTGEALPHLGLGEGPTEKELHLLCEAWQKDTQEPRLNLKITVDNIKSSFHERHETYFRSRYLLPLLYLETSDGNRVCGEVRFCKVYTTVGDEEIQLSVAPPQTALGHLAPWRSGKVSFELGFTIKGPTAYNIQYEDIR